MAMALLGLGANIDSPIAQLTRALETLRRHADIEIMGVSRVYRSQPLGPADQPDFLNAAARISTCLSPTALLDAVKAIEQQQGRVSGRRWGERCIDLDILLYDGITLETEALCIPHPGIRARSFVLDPLIDLLGSQFKMPSGEELGKLRALCPEGGIEVTDFELLIPSSAEN